MVNIERVSNISSICIKDDKVTLEIKQADESISNKNLTILEAAAVLCMNLSCRITKMMMETIINLKLKINSYRSRFSNTRISMYKEKISVPSLFDIRSLYKWVLDA